MDSYDQESLHTHRMWCVWSMTGMADLTHPPSPFPGEGRLLRPLGNNCQVQLSYLQTIVYVWLTKLSVQVWANMPFS